RGVDLLVACPGRLEDLIAQGDVDLSDVHWAVLDEADRMADMGFLPAVKRLLDQISADRQLLLFSATLDGDVDVIVRRYLDQPKRHSVVTDEELSGTVLHHWWALGRDDRTALTAELVRSHAPAVVFCRTKHGADRLTKRLETAGVTAVAVHGDKSQPQRDRAIASFAAGRVDALVATDVAARGIHIDGVACVIHFDPPADPKDYTHRSGRTGRAGADGVVVTLVTPDVAKAVAGLQRALGMPKGTARPDVAGLPAAAPRPEPKPLPTRSDRSDRPSGGRPPGGKPGSGRPRRPRSDDGRGWERRGRDESRRDGFPGRSGQGAGSQGRSSSGIQRNHRAGQPGGPGQRQGQGGGRRRTAGR
ncbi:MAG TPA: DEAD/DEAH box helicase, partial [Acidimicrobiales bacterium]|nr:DEAD/DEAH box helicase [Acidimicrobiales bacterium]